MKGKSIASIALLSLACAKGKEAATDTAQTIAPPPSTASAAVPGAGGKVIVIEAISDEKGNYFKPNEIEAHKGDLLRFTLKVGVHNVDFLPDSNAGKSNLPPASAMLQLPGQTVDIPVTFAEGTYYFQCDPHVALGMKGHVKVKD